MTSTRTAFAVPRKSFFVNMFTKDIPLEDCLLDLIDNSVDGLFRSANISPNDISNAIFDPTFDVDTPGDIEYRVSLRYGTDFVEVSDNCGGIDIEHAVREVFNFGHSSGADHGYIGVYGIGMKRALFKIGRQFDIVSRTTRSGFRCSVDVEEWLAKDDTIDDWSFELREEEPADNERDCGTTIRITSLNPTVARRLRQKRFSSHLMRQIRQTYQFFLDRFVRIDVNGVRAAPQLPPLGSIGEPSYQRLSVDDVEVTIIATIASVEEGKRPQQDNAGWYVICNGRVVLAADKTDRTGWGQQLPKWHSKFVTYIGLVFFESTNPLSLPWTTTKRELNHESNVYQAVKRPMDAAARPVLDFLNRKYPSDDKEKSVSREIASSTKPTTYSGLRRPQNTRFQATETVPEDKKTIKVQFDVKLADIELIKKHLRNRRLSGKAIGLHALDYFMKREGLRQ